MGFTFENMVKKGLLAERILLKGIPRLSRTIYYVCRNSKLLFFNFLDLNQPFRSSHQLSCSKALFLNIGRITCEVVRKRQ